MKSYTKQCISELVQEAVKAHQNVGVVCHGVLALKHKMKEDKEEATERMTHLRVSAMNFLMPIRPKIEWIAWRQFCAS